MRVDVSPEPVQSPLPPLDGPPGRLFDISAAAIIAVCAAGWLWFGASHDLLQDEAYYWQWSRHLSAGYYDNTPAVAFVIRLFTCVFGDTQLGVRFGAVLCAATTAALLYRIGRELFGARAALAALVLGVVNPFFGAGAWIMTQDPVQLAFWAATAWAAWRAARAQDRSAASWGLWLLAGVAAGLTALAKLNGLLVLPSVLLFLAIDPPSRRWLTRPQPYVAAALALAVFAPFVWWNHMHGDAFWIHIDAMGHRTNGSHGRPTLKFLGDFLGSQAILLSPLLFLTYLWSLVTTPRRAASSDVAQALRYCWSLSVVVFAATILLSLRSRVEGNWAVAAYVTGLILVGYAAAESWRAGRVRRAWYTAAVVLAGAITLLTYISTMGTAGPRIRPLDKRTDELYGWKRLAARVSAEESAMGAHPFVFGVNYRMPSELAFYLPGQPETYSLFLHVRANEYMFWEDERRLIGRDAIMVNDTPTPDHLADARAVFRRVVVAAPVRIFRAPYRRPIRVVQIFRCYGFKGYSRRAWQDGW